MTEMERSKPDLHNFITRSDKKKHHRFALLALQQAKTERHQRKLYTHNEREITSPVHIAGYETNNVYIHIHPYAFLIRFSLFEIKA